MTIQKFEVPDWIRSVLICDPTDIWGNVVGIGLNELIACLTPTKRFDRRGDIYFVEGFEHGFGSIVQNPIGTLSAVALTSSEARYGGLAVKLTGGSTLGVETSIQLFLPPPNIHKIGAEFTFRIGDDVDYLAITIDYRDGIKQHIGRVQYSTAGDKWQYLDHEDNLQDLITGISLSAVEGYHYTAKLVIDAVNDTYMRLLTHGLETVMTTLPLYTPTVAHAPMLRIEIYVASTVGDNGWIIVDSLTITQNEPS